MFIAIPEGYDKPKTKGRCVIHGNDIGVIPCGDFPEKSTHVAS